MFKQLTHYENIAAIIPCYTATGDSTTIISTNGSQKTIPRRISTVLQHLARKWTTDLTALKQKATHITDSSILQPLSLAPGFVLCPLKVRIPRIPGDTSIGYINLHAAHSVTESHEKPYQTRIKLIGGVEVSILWKPNTVKKHLQQGKLTTLYTAHNPALHPALTLIAQKQVEVMYDLLLFQRQSLHHQPTNTLMALHP